MIKAQAIFLDWEEEDAVAEIDKVCRMNSRFARTRNIPRDVMYILLIRFYSSFFNTGFKIESTDIIVLKIIPIRILCKRKEYSFFV